MLHSKKPKQLQSLKPVVVTTGGTQKWKTVSMDIHGCWYADECEPHELKEGYEFFQAPYGFDTYLHIVPKCDTHICDWRKSVVGVN